MLDGRTPESIAGDPQQTRQIDKPNGLPVRQINELFHLEFRERAADGFERRAQVIGNIRARKQKHGREGPLRIFGEVPPNAQEKLRNSGNAVLLAHRDQERQSFRKNLVSTAGFTLLADSGNRRTQYPTICDCLGREMLTR